MTCVRRDAGSVDLVVLDLRLPQGQGIDAVRALRKIEGFRAPIVVFGGTIAHAEEVRTLSALGVAGYVNEYTAVQHIVPALAPHLFPDHYNRRSSPRFVLGIPVAYRMGNTIAAALTLNISRGGSGHPDDEPVGTRNDGEGPLPAAWRQQRHRRGGTRVVGRSSPRDGATVYEARSGGPKSGRRVRPVAFLLQPQSVKSVGNPDPMSGIRHAVICP
jgi:hypothetical protein